MGQNFAKKFGHNSQDISGLEGLESIILNDDEATKYGRSELYDVSVGSYIYGPILNEDLKAFLLQNSQFTADVKISGYRKNEWISIFKHPLFAKKKAILREVPKSTPDLPEEHSDGLLILKNGNKWGPFDLSEIKNLMNGGDLIITDMISDDGGENWKRIYEMEEFDRRSFTRNENLPYMPEWNVFKNSYKEVETDLNNKSSDEEKAAMANLAFLESIEEERVKKHQEKVAKSSIKNEVEQKSFMPYIILGIMLITLSGTLYLYKFSNNTKSEELFNSKFKKASERLRETTPQKPKRSTVEKAPKRNRTKTYQEAREQARLESRQKLKQKSFQKSPERLGKGYTAEPLPKDEPILNEDDYGYDEPVEQDDIASQLSKEIIDPDEIFEDGGDYFEQGYPEDEQLYDDFGDMKLKKEKKSKNQLGELESEDEYYEEYDDY